MNVTKCKHTGLTKHQEDHWIIKSDTDPNSWASLFLLGDDIFVGEWHGYITKELNDRSDIVFSEIQEKFDLKQKGYHYILDNTNVRGVSIEVRAQYTPFLKKEIIYMKSHMLVGLHSVLKFITSIAMKLNKDFAITEYHHNLHAAIKSIQKSTNKLPSYEQSTSPTLTNNDEEKNLTPKTKKQDIESPNNSLDKRISNLINKINRSEEGIWRYWSGSSYYIYGEIIDETIIYCKQHGDRTMDELNVFFKINEEMLDVNNNKNTILIEYIGNSKDVSDNKRKNIVSFYYSLIGKIKHLIFINPTIFQKASILMSKYLLRGRYKVHIVKSKGDAFNLAYKIKREEGTDEVLEFELGHTKNEKEVEKRIDQLLNIVGRISWDPTFDDQYSDEVVGNDEFSILFESFEMLRTDIVSMKRDLESHSKQLKEEVEKATSKLRKQNIELEKAKEEAIKANKLKSAFLANMSHEIRTPMNAIVGLTNILKEGNVSEEDKKTYLNLISKSNEHLLKLINDVVDISKIESKEMTISPHKFNLNNLMREILESQKIALLNSKKADKIDFSLHLGLPDELSNIETDSTRLKQILLNLLNNAYKFTPSGKIEFGYNLEKDTLYFYVKDSGIGIESSKLDYIFDRFTQAEGETTRKYGGTGLGLSISKSLVELCGGTISVESTVGEGSTFKFNVHHKCKTDPETESLQQNINEIERKDTENKNTDTSLNILIAEDDNINFIVLKAILNTLNCNIKRVVTGKEAVAEIEKNTDYDIILMDIQMPEMDGIEATKLIKNITDEIPIIAITANAFEDERQKIKAVGCIDYITKPIDKELLIKSITENTIRN